VADFDWMSKGRAKRGAKVVVLDPILKGVLWTNMIQRALNDIVKGGVAISSCTLTMIVMVV
jgi:hypothetical protein